MNSNLVAIIKRIVAEQGEAILGDPQRLKSFVSDYAKNEPTGERLALGRCLESGAYAELKNAPDPQRRVTVKKLFARKVNANAGIDIDLCNDALDVLEAALFGTIAGQQPQSPYPPPPPAMSQQPAAPQVYRQPAQQQYQAQRQSAPSGYQPASAHTPNSVPQTVPAAKSKTLRNILIAAGVIAVAVLIIVNLPAGIGAAASGWKGYEDFDSFSRAIDMDEVFGEKMTEESFEALMLLGIMFSDDIHWDIVSGDKLTERYAVPAAMRERYAYLVKSGRTAGSETYCAYFSGDRWVVLYWTME